MTQVERLRNLSSLERIGQKPGVIPRVLLLSTHIAKAFFTFSHDSEKVLDQLQKNLDKSNSYLRLMLMAPSLGKALGQVRKLRATVASWFDISPKSGKQISGDLVQKIVIDTIAPSVYEVSDTLKLLNKVKILPIAKFLPTVVGAGSIAGMIISAKKIGKVASDYFQGRGENHMSKLAKNTAAFALAMFSLIPQTRPLTLAVYTVYTAADISLNFFL